MNDMTPTKIEDVSKNKLSKGEKVFIVLDGILALGGLVMIVLGFIADFYPGKPEDNWTGQAAFQNAMHLSYRWFGVILLLVAALIAAIALNGFARKNDTDNERALRRAQRLKIISESEKVTAEHNQNHQQNPHGIFVGVFILRAHRLCKGRSFIMNV